MCRSWQHSREKILQWMALAHHLWQPISSLLDQAKSLKSVGEALSPSQSTLGYRTWMWCLPARPVWCTEQGRHSCSGHNAGRSTRTSGPLLWHCRVSKESPTLEDVPCTRRRTFHVCKVNICKKSMNNFVIYLHIKTHSNLGDTLWRTGSLFIRNCLYKHFVIYLCLKNCVQDIHFVHWHLQ